MPQPVIARSQAYSVATWQSRGTTVPVKASDFNAEVRRGGPLVGRTPRRVTQRKAETIKTETAFPSPDRLRPLKPGSKLTFIPSLTVSTTYFDEIPFPVGKDQVRGKTI
jgi:hypothetical protein